ncbi:MAG: DUF3644 domain-containing protein [Candidatus Poribacteria bacterium]|nr:DUF3644 domain-containing protein [Candidatus Poribacteria bacterium]
MKSRSQLLLEKAIAAMVSAIEIYNKPAFRYRGETFSILAINGWELLLKAKWLVDNEDNPESLYIEDKNSDDIESQATRFLLNRSKNPRTRDIGFLAEKLVEKKLITKNVWTNIQALLVIRDNSIHFYNSTMQVANKLQIVGAASVRNFAVLVKEWFDNDMSEFNFDLMPLSFMTLPSKTEALLFNMEEANFLEDLRHLEAGADQSDSRYAVTINFEIKLSRSNDTDAPEVRVTSKPDAIPIRMTEEQDLQKYPWDFKKLTDKCRARYSDFKQDKKYYGIKKSLSQDESNGLCKIRYLDPRNEKSSKKELYHPDILKEFDKHYTKAVS